MKRTVIHLFLCAALFAIPAAADDVELLRQDLLDYVAGLRAIPPSVMEKMAPQGLALDEAEASIRKLTPEELRIVDQTLAGIPYWREAARAIGDQAKGPSVPSADVAASLRALETDIMRQQLIGLMNMVESVPPELVPADYHQRVASVKAEIQKLGYEDLKELQANVQQNIPRWSDQIRAAGAPIQPMNDCGSSLSLDKIKCEINHIFADIAALPGKVANFATSAVNTIKDGLLNFLKTLSAVLPSPQTFANTLGNAGSILSKFPDAIRLPCFNEGFNIPFFGEVGQLATSQRWDRTIGFVGNVVEEATPDDVWSGNLKAIASVVNFIPQHISWCLQNSYDDAFKAAQETHRDLVDDNLDAKVSSRGTQTSVNSAQAKTSDIDSDVAKVEGKLDVLDVTAGRLRDLQAINRMFLEEFRKMALRMRIEVDLLRQSNFRISLFQLPEQFGGHLETARDIVAATLASREQAGLDVKNARQDFNSGVQQQSQGNYKGAYGAFRKAYQRAVLIGL